MVYTLSTVGEAIISPSKTRRFVAYYRVSTERQGSSGLGFEAQQKAVRDYLNGGAWELVAEHVEIESGKRADRPELAKALEACKRHKARLVIAKLDRLSRNLAFIATLMEAGVEFLAVDNPHANKLTVHILAAVAQHEREMISERTTAALQAAKARGVRLGKSQSVRGRGDRPGEGARGGTATRRQCAAGDPRAASGRRDKPQRHCQEIERPQRPHRSGPQVVTCASGCGPRAM